jgi:dihydroflavonol-4-reductase
MKACEIVIHTASPFVISNYKDAVKDIIEPAVKGTINVLETANRTTTVKRVVVTSSIASILEMPSKLKTQPTMNLMKVIGITVVVNTSTLFLFQSRSRT